ncbi:hypothetical protein CY35_08G066200 [Sphagnum magellanicum]|nr:hypothetical protein CY35_08G066200 [Sphagnum magellanicum]
MISLHASDQASFLSARSASISFPDKQSKKCTTRRLPEYRIPMLRPHDFGRQTCCLSQRNQVCEVNACSFSMNFVCTIQLY